MHMLDSIHLLLDGCLPQHRIVDCLTRNMVELRVTLAVEIGR
jgi:hypothetical protein